MNYSPRSQTTVSNASDALVGSGSYELTQLDTLTGSLSATKSKLTTLLFNTGTPTGVAGVNLAGTRDLLRLQANQSWQHDWSEASNTQESFVAGSQMDWDSPSNLSTLLFTTTVVTNYAYHENTYGFTVAETSTQRNNQAVAAGSQLPRWSHVATATVNWARPLSAASTLALNAGASRLIIGDSPVRPVGRATFNYRSENLTWSLGLSHSQSGDLQLGTVFTTDALTANASFSPFEGVPLTLTAGATLSSLVVSGAHARSAQAQALARYSHRYFLTTLLVTTLQQVGAEQSPIPTLDRTAITLTLGGVFPPQ